MITFTFVMSCNTAVFDIHERMNSFIIGLSEHVKSQMRFTFSKGVLFFHFMPKLCLSEILVHPNWMMNVGSFDFVKYRFLLSPYLLLHFLCFQEQCFLRFIFLNVCFYRTEIRSSFCTRFFFFFGSTPYVYYLIQVNFNNFVV